MNEPGKYTIVIVEDEGLIAEDIRRQLVAVGYQVPGVADAAPEAMRVIRATSPDLVLMDIRIKGDEDGIHVAQKVRDDLDVPVVFLTAYEDTRTLERASETHPYGYIRKPISGASLRGSIEIAIAKHRHDRQVREQRDWAMTRFAAVPYAVVATDVEGRVIWLNSPAEELTGWNRESASGRHCSEVLHLFSGGSGLPLKTIIPRAVLHGETTRLPAGLMLSFGDEREAIPVEGSIAPACRGDCIDGAVIAFQDASRTRFEEEQRLLAHKHEALRRLLENITFRLPNLHLVDAAWNTMLMTEALKPPSHLRESIDEVHRGVMDSFSVACRLSMLLKAPEVRLDRVVLSELLPQLENALQPNAPELDIVAGPEPISVHADGGSLTSALLTFVHQARRRMKTGGRLVIDVSRPEARDLRHWVRIRLTYPSAEAPETILESSFEPGWQNSAQDPYIAYELIRKMGGLLTARAAANDTIVVEIYLQQVRAAAAGRHLRLVDAPDESRTNEIV